MKCGKKTCKKGDVCDKITMKCVLLTKKAHPTKLMWRRPFPILKCKKGKIYNPQTGKCISKRSKVGRKIKIAKVKFFKSRSLGRPDYNKFVTIRIAIAPSTIKGAGLGAYALDTIPRGYMSKYKGQKVTLNKTFKVHGTYAWTIVPYHSKSGLQKEIDEPLCYIDAYNAKKSNWARYVNCGMKNKYNNMKAFQYFHKMYYKTKRKVYPGEELFIDYGPEYRDFYLGIKKYY